VLAGGPSGEHEVSLRSGAAVRAGLVAAGHEPVAIEIDRDGRWRSGGRTLALEPGGGLLGCAVAFPALHGPYGEDGVVQGVLEALAVPYAGAGVLASALCMDKVLFKDLMASAGVGGGGARRPGPPRGGGGRWSTWGAGAPARGRSA
jgi:D-alanine-D-alanine ligase